MKIGDHHSAIGSYAIMSLLCAAIVIAAVTHREPVHSTQTHLASR